MCHTWPTPPFRSNDRHSVQNYKIGIMSRLPICAARAALGDFPANLVLISGEFRVLCPGLVQDRDLRIRILPQGEEILVSR